MKRTKAAVTEVGSGFVWRDPERGHVVACGDAADSGDVGRALEGLGDPALGLIDPPYNLPKKDKIEFKTRTPLGLDEEWDRFEDADFARFLGSVVAVAGAAVTAGNLWIWTSDWWLSDVKRWFRAAGRRVWPTYHWCKPNPPPSVRRANPTSAVEYVAMSGARDGAAFFDLAAMPRQRNYYVLAPDGEGPLPAVTPWWVERPVVSQYERIKRAGTTRDLNATQKPLDLVEALVRAGAPEGGVVLDTCGGTGTTLVAADRADRICVYLDNDPEQVRAAASRLIRDRGER